MLAHEVTDTTVREMHREKIRDFLSLHSRFLAHGDVLDYGCGDSPYRSLVLGNYVGWNRADLPGTPYRENVGPDHPLDGNMKWDAILCTQVLQYVPDPMKLLYEFHNALKPNGVLLITIATNWPEVETEDLHRFTSRGANQALATAGFRALYISHTGYIAFGHVGADFNLPLGWGFVCELA